MKRSLSLLAAVVVMTACQSETKHDDAKSPDDRFVEIANERVATNEVSANAGELKAIKGPTDEEEMLVRKIAVGDEDSATKNPQEQGMATEFKIARVATGKKKADQLESALDTDMFAGATRGGGTSRGISLGNLASAGRGGGGRGGSGYGTGVGSLGERRVRVPQVRHGSAVVRGSMPDPSGAEQYTNHGTNKFTDASEDRFSTFAVDVDTGSYTIARRKLNSGQLPPSASVRVEEFVNYFGYSYPKPDSGAFRVSMEAAPSPFATDGKRMLFRVGVQGKTIPSTERKPVHLTFLVDVSGSMRRPDKIGLVKKSLEMVASNLQPTDTVAIATYAGRTGIALQPTGAKDQHKIRRAIEDLDAGGSTAMESGLKLAYDLAAKTMKPGHESRVIVLSDGDANVGRTSWEDMLTQIRGQVKKGVTMSTIGFGMGNYKDSLMEQLANNGNGNYFYVDTEKEARKIFGDQLDGTMQTIAKDVKIQVEFHDDAVRRYRLVGYENRDIADKDFRNDKVDAGEIGAGHTVTALYELELTDELPERIATVRVRHKQPHGSDKASEQTFALDRTDLKSSLSASTKDFQFAAAVCAFAEKLRKSPYAKSLTWDWILEIANTSLRGRADRREFVQLVKKARKLS